MDFLISLSIVPKRQSCHCALCYIATEHNEYSPFCLTSNSLTEPSKTPRNGCLVAQCFDGQNIDEGGSSLKQDRCSHRFAIIVTGHPIAWPVLWVDHSITTHQTSTWWTEIGGHILLSVRDQLRDYLPDTVLWSGGTPPPQPLPFAEWPGALHQCSAYSGEGFALLLNCLHGSSRTSQEWVVLERLLP